jgi:hypothetical protein
MSETESPQKLADVVGTGLTTLPDPVQTGFWRAAGRLVGGMLATPAALLRRPAQKIEDKTEAQSIVTRRIAEAAAERAAADPGIVERAMESLVRDEFRKQENKENVVKAAASVLDEEPAPETPKPDTEKTIEEDWLNVFARYAEDASSEKMQKLWGRVLAGEVRSPGSFSLSTIRFLSELDPPIAQAFESVASFIVGDTIFYSDDRRSGHVFQTFMALESAGLISLGAGFLKRNATLNASGAAHIGGSHLCLQVTGEPGTKIEVPVVVLTRLGREVSTLLPKYDEQPEMKAIAKYLSEKPKIREKLSKIELGVLIYSDGIPIHVHILELLWNKP